MNKKALVTTALSLLLLTSVTSMLANPGRIDSNGGIHVGQKYYTSKTQRN
ncbi:hypothetical protein [Paenibacillus solani]